VASSADLTVSTIPVTRDAARSLGIMQMDAERRVVRFVEKPQEPDLLDTLHLDRASYGSLGIQGDQEYFLASMGIYLFNRNVLFHVLDNDLADFGKHVIPQAIQSHRVFSHVFQGYWEDIGTIRSFFDANLDLAAELPRFNFFDMTAPIYTRPRFLPASKINGASIDHAIISEGCIVSHCHVSHSVVGVRSLVDIGSHITRTIIMGADYYETPESLASNMAENRPRLGIGKYTRIDQAIIDKNTRIGDNCVITPHGKPQTADHPLYYLRDGIVIIPKDMIVPHGTVI
jgi:glucose-1-phosphate adenylyltransferase